MQITPKGAIKSHKNFILFCILFAKKEFFRFVPESDNSNTEEYEERQKLKKSSNQDFRKKSNSWISNLEDVICFSYQKITCYYKMNIYFDNQSYCKKYKCVFSSIYRQNDFFANIFCKKKYFSLKINKWYFFIKKSLIKK